MAATIIVSQERKLAAAGLVVTWNEATAAGTGDKFLNPNGTCFMLAKNDSASPVDVTISVEQTVGGAGLVVPDLVVTVAAGVTKLIGPFPKDDFNDSGGYVNLDCSLETTLTYAILHT